MKKFLISLLVIAVVGGNIAWSKRVDIILALVKYKSSQNYADVAPPRDIPWQQGPTESVAIEGERPLSHPHRLRIYPHAPGHDQDGYGRGQDHG